MVSYRGGVRGVRGSIICSPSFHFIWGTYLNPMFAFFKGYNYVSNLIFMFGWSGLHRVLRMTHLEAAPTMTYENNWLLGSIVVCRAAPAGLALPGSAKNTNHSSNYFLF